MQLLKDFIYKCLSVQEKFLRLRLSKTLGIKNMSKRKRHYSEGCTVDLNSIAEEEKQKLEDMLLNILKKYDYNQKKILEYIQKQGTEVVLAKDAKRILHPLGENEGFIYPAKGAKALYLSLSLFGRIKFKTNELFVLSEGNINKYYFLYHLYNWFAYKHNIEGMDTESHELLQKYLCENSDTKELQLADIYKLKDAIRQDKASIEFVIKLCRNYEGAKQALTKMQNNGSAKL